MKITYVMNQYPAFSLHTVIRCAAPNELWTDSVSNDDRCAMRRMRLVIHLSKHRAGSRSSWLGDGFVREGETWQINSVSYIGPGVKTRLSYVVTAQRPEIRYRSGNLFFSAILRPTTKSDMAFHNNIDFARTECNPWPFRGADSIPAIRSNGTTVKRSQVDVEAEARPYSSKTDKNKWRCPPKSGQIRVGPIAKVLAHVCVHHAVRITDLYAYNARVATTWCIWTHDIKPMPLVSYRIVLSMHMTASWIIHWSVTWLLADRGQTGWRLFWCWHRCIAGFALCTTFLR